jgi:hypothetical protein
MCQWGGMRGRVVGLEVESAVGVVRWASRLTAVGFRFAGGTLRQQQVRRPATDHHEANAERRQDRTNANPAPRTTPPHGQTPREAPAREHHARSTTGMECLVRHGAENTGPHLAFANDTEGRPATAGQGDCGEDVKSGLCPANRMIHPTNAQPRNAAENFPQPCRHGIERPLPGPVSVFMNYECSSIREHINFCERM